MVLLDTHAWIWWLEGAAQLEARYHRALRRLGSPPFLSVISLWEITLLIKQSKIALAATPKTWLREATLPDTVRLAEIGAGVAEELLSLPAAVPRDPADQIIVATARWLDVPLLTVDRKILASGAVRTWDV